jgi:hypothetical protein
MAGGTTQSLFPPSDPCAQAIARIRATPILPDDDQYFAWPPGRRFATLVEVLRADFGLSTKAILKKSGIPDETTLSRHMMGREAPPLVATEALAACLGPSADANTLGFQNWPGLFPANYVQGVPLVPAVQWPPCNRLKALLGKMDPQNLADRIQAGRPAIKAPTVSAIVSWEGGRYVPTPATLGYLLDYLQCPTEPFGISDVAEPGNGTHYESIHQQHVRRDLKGLKPKVEPKRIPVIQNLLLETEEEPSDAAKPEAPALASMPPAHQGPPAGAGSPLPGGPRRGRPAGSKNRVKTPEATPPVARGPFPPQPPLGGSAVAVGLDATLALRVQDLDVVLQPLGTTVMAFLIQVLEEKVRSAATRAASAPRG